MMTKAMSKEYHQPVMLRESVEAMQINPAGTYVDLTFGGGGHSEAILAQLAGGRLFAFDQDADAKSQAAALKANNFTFIQANFRYFAKYLRMYNVTRVDGILADLGISSHQIDAPQRGFSIRFDAPLDMRMDTGLSVTAAQVLNTYKEKDLVHIFSAYGEIKNARTLARTIVSARSAGPVQTTGALRALVSGLARPGRENRYLAQVFQALRIEVNDELGALHDMLQQAADILAPGGRLVVLTYHSLEDRPVKHFINTGNIKGIAEKDFYGNLIRPLKPVFRKPLTASAAEIARNNRARSAKLRVGEKIDNHG